MKKVWLICFVAILFMVSFSFAQSPRDPTSSEGKTSFTNIAVTGINNNGNHNMRNPGTPSYIEMINGAGSRYYLYVTYNGVLAIASDVAVGYLASPATVSWQQASGVPVGSQQ